VARAGCWAGYYAGLHGYARRRRSVVTLS